MSPPIMIPSDRSMVEEMRQIGIAVDLIKLGARLQVLTQETLLSRGQLVGLYKEIRGMSPPKGMLPYSAAWFTTWHPNIHASLFYNIFINLRDHYGCPRIEAFIHAYRLYVEQTICDGSELELELTRAWTLLRFFESGLLKRIKCRHCQGYFVAGRDAVQRTYVCGLCRPPSRAGSAGAGKARRGRRADPAALSVRDLSEASA